MAIPRHSDQRILPEPRVLQEALQSALAPPTITRSEAGAQFVWLAPRRYVWAQVTLPIPGLPRALSGLRLLHFSDLHLRYFWSPAYDRFIQEVAARAPDILLFTGDFKDNHHEPRGPLQIIRRLFTALRPRLATYAILGNHDTDEMAPHIASMGIGLVDHRRMILGIAGEKLELIGLPGVGRTDLDLDWMRQLPARQDGIARVVLCHYPDLIRWAHALEPDLYLAGHTHGGQICLPSGYPPATHDTLPRQYAKGVHRIGRTWLCVSQGMGVTGLPFRLFCPPEVMEITLTPAS